MLLCVSWGGERCLGSSEWRERMRRHGAEPSAWGTMARPLEACLSFVPLYVSQGLESAKDLKAAILTHMRPAFCACFPPCRVHKLPVLVEITSKRSGLLYRLKLGKSWPILDLIPIEYKRVKTACVYFSQHGQTCIVDSVTMLLSRVGSTTDFF